MLAIKNANKITIIIKMTSYNRDVNSYFLIAIDFSHNTITSNVCTRCYEKWLLLVALQLVTV